MAEKKNYARGGGVLLKKHGPNYFRDLAKKKAKIDRKARELWNKTHPKLKIAKKKKTYAGPVEARGK